MSVIEKSIEVDVPVRNVYDQWTQFEDFPEFMEGVERVEQLDDTTLRWQVSIAGVDREFEATIADQDPDRRVAWQARGDEGHSGVVTFEPVQQGRTRVHLELTWEPERWTDKVADALNLVDRRAENDLERFKSFIEERGGQPTGAWRGDVSGGESYGGGAGATGVATESGAAGDVPPGQGGEWAEPMTGEPGDVLGGDDDIERR
jgi:uncharacterized membrane protein